MCKLRKIQIKTISQLTNDLDCYAESFPKQAYDVLEMGTRINLIDVKHKWNLWYHEGMVKKKNENKKIAAFS